MLSLKASVGSKIGSEQEAFDGLASGNHLIDKKLEQMMGIFQKYRQMRLELLKAIECESSCRDPLSEFSEILVAKLLDAKRAKNRVQKGYDLVTPTGEKVQVKYLSNPKRDWINWHTVVFDGLQDRYALVYYEELTPKAVFVFRKQGLDQLCKALGKRHGKTETELQFTKTNYRDMVKDPPRYEKLGVKIHLLE